MARPIGDISLFASVTDDPGELFIEASKVTRYSEFPPQEFIYERMVRLLDALPYKGYPFIKLPPPQKNLSLNLGEAIVGRTSARSLNRIPVALSDLSTLLFSAYGITRPNNGTSFPRPFRTVPSGGALYPLEIYFSAAGITEISDGIYHYSPVDHGIRCIVGDDQSEQLSGCFVDFQNDIPCNSSLLFFITSVFERSSFKYGARGYRFAFLEAGHVAQNLNLVSEALGLGVLNIGGYYDDKLDQLLRIDGVTQSTIYVVAVGGKGGEV